MRSTRNKLKALKMKLWPVLAAGTLLQATGCQFDAQAAAFDLLTSVSNSLVQTFLFNSFNLI